MEGLFIIYLRLVFCLFQVYSLFILRQKCNSAAIEYSLFSLLGPPDLYTSHDGSHVGPCVGPWVRP